MKEPKTRGAEGAAAEMEKEVEAKTMSGPPVTDPLVTVFGARRTGTNVVAWLLRENFHCRLDAEATGHKHYEPVDDGTSPHVVVCVRHPLAWLVGLHVHWSQVCRNRDKEPREFEEWVENDAAPEGWNRRYKAWLGIGDKLVVKVEDLDGGQGMFLRRVTHAWGLKAKHGGWVTSDRRFNKSGEPRANRFSPREWKNRFDGPTLDSLRERFDMALVQELGYRI